MVLSISFLNASSDCSINYRCRKRKDGPYAAEYFEKSRNWKDKNKTAFVIKYVLQILHRPFIAVLGMFSIRCFSLTVSKIEL